MQKKEIGPDWDTQEVEKHAECGIREEETANHRGRGMEESRSLDSTRYLVKSNSRDSLGTGEIANPTHQAGREEGGHQSTPISSHH